MKKKHDKPLKYRGIYQVGNVLWYQYKGHKVSTGIHTYDPNAWENAKHILDDIKAKVFLTGNFPDKIDNTKTIKDLQDFWFKHLDAVEKVSARDDRQRFNYIVEHFGNNQILSDLAADDILNFKKFLLSHKKTFGKGIFSIATTNRVLALFKSALRHAQDNDWNIPNRILRAFSIKNGGMEKEKNQRNRTATPDEIDSILSTITLAGKCTINDDLILAICVATETPLRLGAIANMKWELLEFKDNISIYRPEEGPENKHVPELCVIRSRATELLRNRRGIKGNIFKSTARQMSSAFSWHVSQTDIEKQATIRGEKFPDLHFHDLKHTALTNLNKAGVDHVQLKKISGHKTFEMLDRYVNPDEATIIAAYEKLTAAK